MCENQLQPFTLTKFSSAVTTLLVHHYIFNIEYIPQTQLVCYGALVDIHGGEGGETDDGHGFAVKWEEWAPKVLSYANTIQKSRTRVYCNLLSVSTVSSGIIHTILSPLQKKEQISFKWGVGVGVCA